MGKAVKSIGQGGGITGIDVIGGAKDLLFGKKTPGTTGGYMEMDPAQKMLMNKYTDLANQDVSKIVENQTVAQQNAVRQAAQDAQMQAQDQVARRGLGNSSVGLNAILNQTRGMGEKFGAIQAQAPMMQRQLQLENLGTATSGIQNLLGSRMYQTPTAATRTGGLAPLIGAGIGAAVGGPAGAQVGMGIGQASQGAFG